MAKGLGVLEAADQAVAKAQKKRRAAVRALNKKQSKAHRDLGAMFKEFVLDVDADRDRVTGWLLSYAEATEKEIAACVKAGAAWRAQVEADAARVLEPFGITFAPALTAADLGMVVSEMVKRGWKKVSKFEHRWEGLDDHESASRLAALHNGELRRLGVVEDVVSQAMRDAAE